MKSPSDKFLKSECNDQAKKQVTLQIFDFEFYHCTKLLSDNWLYNYCTYQLWDSKVKSICYFLFNRKKIWSRSEHKSWFTSSEPKQNGHLYNTWKKQKEQKMTFKKIFMGLYTEEIIFRLWMLSSLPTFQHL